MVRDVIELSAVHLYVAHLTSILLLCIFHTLVHILDIR